MHACPNAFGHVSYPQIGTRDEKMNCILKFKHNKAYIPILLWVNSIRTNKQIMKNVLILLLLNVSISGLGQDLARLYLDEYGFPSDQSEAKSYRTIRQHHSDHNKYLVNDYYLNDSIKQSSSYLDNQMYVQEGLFTSYYANGKKKEEGHYDDNSRVGNWTKWYYNGQIQEEYSFDDSKEYYKRLKIINLWDSLGTQLVINGKGECIVKEDEPLTYSKGSVDGGLKNGVWTGFNNRGDILFEEEYSQNKLIKGISYDANGKKYKYDILTESILLPFYKFVAKSIRYPADARRRGIQGSVLIQILFDTKGQILKSRVIRGIGGGCDEEALRIVNGYSGKWGEGTKRGQPLSIQKPQTMILPITFRLG